MFNFLSKIYVAIVFCVTGFVSLSYQVAWNKILSQTIGSDYYSTTIIVSIFMLGLGAGGYIGGAVVRYVKAPVYIFFIVEIIISLFGLISVDLLRIAPILLSHVQPGLEFDGSLIIDFAINLLILIVPITLMGVSLPIMADYYKNKLAPGAEVGMIYSLNIVGASVGAFISGFYLIGTIGIALTIDLASYLNLSLALFGLVVFLIKDIEKFLNLIVLLKSRGGRESIKDYSAKMFGVKERSVDIIYQLKKHKLLFLLTFLIGFIALAYEVLYFRVFIYYLSANTYVFPIVLSIYLLFMMFGNYIAAQGLALKFKVETIMLISITGIVLTSPFLFLVPDFIRVIDSSTVHSVFDLQFRTFYGALGFNYYVAISIIVTSICMIPVIFISMFFPVLIQLNSYNMPKVASNTGLIYLIQTYGNFTGAVVTGLILFPIVGVVTLSKLLIVMMFFVTIFLVYINQKIKLFNLYMHIALPVMVVLSLMQYNHNGFFSNFIYDGGPPVRVVEDLEGTTLIYGPSKSGNYRVNIGAEPSTSYSTIFKNQSIWPIDGAMTLLERDPKRILIIGIGNAQQVISLKKIYPNAEIVIVELLSSLIQDMKQYGSKELQNLLSTSQVHITDGRRYVQKNINSLEKFDFIQVGVYRTTTAGAGNLFTREFLSNLKKILSVDGVISFNAYMPAVKAALREFNNIVIMARSEHSVSDVIMSNKESKVHDFVDKYIHTRKNIFDKINKEGMSQLFSKNIPLASFFIIGNEEISLILEEIEMQTDDKIPTEYFFTNRTKYFKNGEDSRNWPLVKSAYLTELIKNN